MSTIRVFPSYNISTIPPVAPYLPASPFGRADRLLSIVQYQIILNLTLSSPLYSFLETGREIAKGRRRRPHHPRSLRAPLYPATSRQSSHTRSGGRGRRGLGRFRFVVFQRRIARRPNDAFSGRRPAGEDSGSGFFDNCFEECTRMGGQFSATCFLSQ